MTPEQYQQVYTSYCRQTEERLATLCDFCFTPGSRIGEAARYSLLGKGKRVRAVLTLASCALSSSDWQSALDYACALEMLHCYSLIHDDLPCMDNDDMRRGKPSCHKQFDEATALLAADALLTAAFEVIAGAQADSSGRVRAVLVLAHGGGGKGMLYGQELDKQFETVPATKEQLLTLHRHKTGALIRAAVQLGCTEAPNRDEVLPALENYASEIGLVFQIIDDVLDVTGSSADLGKPAGSDACNGKTTFVTLYGVEGAKKEARRHNDAALAALCIFDEKADFLRMLAKSLLERKT